MPKKELTTELLRRQLGSIDLKDVKEEEMTEAERKEYCAAIFAVWPRLEKDINKFLHSQLLFIGAEADTWERVIFGKGTFNGIDLLREHWQKTANEYQAIAKPDEFDKHKVISEI